MIELLLYQVQKDDSHRFDNVIWKFQKRKGDPDPESTHCEYGFIGSHFGKYDSMMFSSSGRGGFLGKGTRFIGYKIDKEKWKIYPMKLTIEEELELLDECISLCGKWYDWLGIVGMKLPDKVRKYVPKWFRFLILWCSEALNCAAFRAGLAKDNPSIRPSQLLESYRKQNLI